MGLSLHNFLYGAFDPRRGRGDRQAAGRPLAAGGRRQAVGLQLSGPEAPRGAVRHRGDPAALRPRAPHRDARSPRCAGRPTLALAANVGDNGAQRHDGLLHDGAAARRRLAAAARRAARASGDISFAAAAVLGLAFNVKLFEALVPVPAFVLFVWLCWRDERASRSPAPSRHGGGAIRRRRALLDGVRVAQRRLSDRPTRSARPTGASGTPCSSSTAGTESSSRRRRRASRRGARRCRPRTPRPRTPPRHHTPRRHRPPPRSRHRRFTGSRPRPDPAPVPVQPGRLRHPARDAAVRGDRVRARRACAAGAPPAAGAPTGGPPAADRMGGHPRAHALVAGRLPALQLLRAHAAALSGGLHARCRDRARRCIARRGCPRARSVRHLRPARHVRDRHGGGRRGDGQREAGYLAITIAAVLAVPVVAYVGLAFLRSVRLRRWPAWYSPLCVTAGMLGAMLAMPAVRDVLLIRDHSGDQAAEVTLGSSIVDPISAFLL